MSCNFTGYLFVYFTGEHENGEQIYFSISRDGLNWQDLNDGNPVLISDVGEKGVRDPFIIRSADGKKYYIIATDLRIASGKGWEAAQYKGSRSIVVWESTDLINWSKGQLVEMDIPGAGCVWAPESIYHEQTGEYVVFWASMLQEEGDSAPKQRIYCSSTKDFYNFSKPVKYIECDNHIIDTTIIKSEDMYYRISKDETTKTIRMDKGEDLLKGPFLPIESPVLDKILGVEGPAAFQLNGTDQWCLMLDQFATNGGYMPLISEDLSSGEFHVVPSDSYYMGETKKRHGSLINLYEDEIDRLMEKYSLGKQVPAPLFRDPIFDGATDPVVIWNREEKCYYMFYTQRRSTSVQVGYSSIHGSAIGVASSVDGSKWLYRGTVPGLEIEPGHNTFWAPEIIYAEGEYHMYVSYITGIPTDWDYERNILHYTAKDLWDWKYQGELSLSSNRVIDSCIYKIDSDTYKMWYKDEVNNSHTYAAISKDLYQWEVVGAEITDCSHEGANVFELGGIKWMITDFWKGLAVYRSEDFTKWERCQEVLLNKAGKREMDTGIGHHADVVVAGDVAYLFYFCHQSGQDLSEQEKPTCAIQAAKITTDGKKLICDRDEMFCFEW